MGKLFKVIILFSVFIAASPACIGLAGELRPFELPSQKYGGTVQQNVERGNKNKPAVNESVYAEFETKIRDMKEADKKDLRKTFLEKREAAIQKERWEEVKYYEQLIKILENK